MEEKILRVYEAEDKIYAGFSPNIKKGKFILAKGIIIMKNNLPDNEYSQDKVKEIYLNAEKSNTIRDVYFNLEKIIKPHTIIL
jgi:hypothetical protein